MGFSLFGNKKNVERHGSDERSPEQQEIINEERRDMIRGVEDLSETAVKEVMVPRIDVDFIALDTPLDELMQKIQESGHSRFPVLQRVYRQCGRRSLRQRPYLFI